MDTRILTTFPTEGHPSPRITPIINLRDFPVRTPVSGSGRSGTSTALQLVRWWCCRCAEEGFHDIVGIINSSDVASSSSSSSYLSSFSSSSSYTTSPRPPPLPNNVPGYDVCWRCQHIKCHNCLASANHTVQDAIRTFGGLYASPRYIDPVYWECPCGEWAKNRFTEAHATMGMSLCASQTCDFRYRSPQRSTLRPDSIVMNGYGQRLGTADQKIAVYNGPWHWQRRGLGDGQNALLDAFRLRAQQRQTLPHSQPQVDRREGVPGLLSNASEAVSNSTQRMLPPISPASSLSRSGSLDLIWKDGEPAPRYPYRPPPPTSTPGWPMMKSGGITHNPSKSRNSLEVAANDLESQELAYRSAYLAGIPRVPVITICDIDGGGGGENELLRRTALMDKDNGTRVGVDRVSTMSPPSSDANPRTLVPMPLRSHFPGEPSVGVADNVQIQMQMGIPRTAHDQLGREDFPRW